MKTPLSDSEVALEPSPKNNYNSGGFERFPRTLVCASFEMVCSSDHLQASNSPCELFIEQKTTTKRLLFNVNSNFKQKIRNILLIRVNLSTHKNSI